MQVRLLGPVEVLDGAQAVKLGPQQKAVLAELALQPGQVVPVTRLVDGLWGHRLPASPEKALQIAVNRLRAALGDEASLVVTRDPGYMLDLDGDAVDAVRFEELVAAAADDGPDAVASRLRAGLDLWRGPALADVAGFPFAPPVITHLDEVRWAAYERRVEADLSQGLGGELVAELEAVVVDQPLRERLWADLMIALYRAGRQTDALERYQQVRRLLADEVGVEPGPRLRDTERLVLNQDPRLFGVSPVQSAASAPQHEPPRVEVALPDLMTGHGPVFVGRAAEVQRLGELWHVACAGERQVALVCGEPGIGKTRLAAELAASVHDEGAVVLAGRCDEELGLPYQPFVEALRHYLAAEPAAPRLGQYSGELPRLVPGLADLAPDLAPPLRSDPDIERYRLFDAVASWQAASSASVGPTMSQLATAVMTRSR